MSEQVEKCRYMEAAYPDLSAEDCSCASFHRHEPRVFQLASALAVVFQGENPTDEQIAWFLNDADAVVDEFDPTPKTWTVVDLGEPNQYRDLPGVIRRFTINGVEYVIKDAEWEPAVPISRARYDAERAEDSDV
ncbi:MAG: hypothetical protein INR66_14965 [Gordonia polyisoprenivorans]|nr:hypothetical protein [Gordonia polyisoprenivorans]